MPVSGLRGVTLGVVVAAGVAAAEPRVLVAQEGGPPSVTAAVEKGLKAKGVGVAPASDAAAACLSHPPGDRAKCLGGAIDDAGADALLLLSVVELQGRLAITLQLHGAGGGAVIGQESAPKTLPKDVARALAPALKVLAAAVKAAAKERAARPAQAAAPPPAPAREAPAAAAPAPAAPAPVAPPRPPADTAAELVKLAMYDFKIAGARADSVAAVKAVVANELQRSGLFKVTTSDELQSVLALERQKQLMGCSDDASNECMAEIADALGAEYIVTGTVSAISEGLSLDLGLIDVRKVRRAATVVVPAPSDSALLAELPGAVTRLIAPVAERRSGFLVVEVAERGATVKIDGVVRGTTPLDGRLTVAGGSRRVTIEKDGFVTWEKDVRVAFEQVSQEVVTLVPSPDYIARYEARASRMRLGAWISTGVAVAAGAASATFYFLMSARYREFQVHKAKLQMGTEIEGTLDHRAEAERLAASVSFNRAVAIGGLALAGLGAAAAAFFFIAGDSPSRYAKFHDVVAVITPWGAAVQGAF